MNYSRIYEELVLRGKQRVPQGYVERHHIVPKCMGGGDENDNLVALTPEEHFLAHVLLVKIYPEQTGLILAVQKMTQGKERSRNKMYGWLKRRFSEEMKRSQTGSGNTQFGTMWICNVETKKNKKVPKDHPIEPGWIKGRNKWPRTLSFSICTCGKSTEKFKAKFCSECRKDVRQKKLGTVPMTYPKIYGPYTGKDKQGRWIVWFDEGRKKSFTTKQYGSLAQLEDAIGLSPIR